MSADRYGVAVEDRCGDAPDQDQVRAVLKGRYPGHTWEPVTIGHSVASVYRLSGSPSYYLKASPCSRHPDGGFQLGAEAARLPWLAACGIPAPEVVEYDARDGVEWLVTTAIPGRSAAEPWPRQQRAAVVDALADLARALHAIPVAGCPFDRSLAVSVAHARHAADRGLVDSERLGGRPVADLLAALAATTPHREELVVCHGDYCVPNVLLDPQTLGVTGVVDVGRLGVADRYADLALMTRSLDDPRLNPQYEGSAGRRFLRRYGASPADDARLAFYRLLDEFF